MASFTQNSCSESKPQVWPVCGPSPLHALSWGPGCPHQDIPATSARTGWAVRGASVPATSAPDTVVRSAYSWVVCFPFFVEFLFKTKSCLIATVRKGLRSGHSNCWGVLLALVSEAPPKTLINITKPSGFDLALTHSAGVGCNHLLPRSHF